MLCCEYKASQTRSENKERDGSTQGHTGAPRNQIPLQTIGFARTKEIVLHSLGSTMLFFSGNNCIDDISV